MDLLSPGFDLTAENLGKRVKSRMDEVPKPVRAEYAAPPQDVPVPPEVSIPVDLTGGKPLISRGALSALVLSIADSPETHEDKRFCELAASLILKSKDDLVRRQELKEILQVAGAFGLHGCKAYKALDVLSRRAPTGL